MTNLQFVELSINFLIFIVLLILVDRLIFLNGILTRLLFEVSLLIYCKYLLYIFLNIFQEYHFDSFNRKNARVMSVS